MGRITLWVVAFAAVHGSAFADYSRRISEIQSMHQAIAAQLREDENAAITMNIAYYADHCSRAMGLIRSSVDSASDDAWAQAAKDAMARADETIGSAVDSLREPSSLANVFCMRIACEEAQFWGALSGVGVAGACGRLAEIQKVIAEKNANLDAAWSRLSVDDDAVDATARRILEEARDGLRRSVDQLASSRKTALERVAAVLELLKTLDHPTEGAPGIPGTDILGKLGSCLSDPLVILTGMTRVEDDRRARFQSYVESQLRVFAVFDGVRSDALEFVGKYNIDLARAAAQQAKDALGRLSPPTDGQKGAASGLASEFGAKIDARLHECESAWNVFKSNHEGRFFGSLRSDVPDALIDRQAFDDLIAGVTAVDQETPLAGFAGDARNFFGVESYGLRRETADRFRDAIRSQTQAAVDACSDAEGKIGDVSLRQAYDFAKVYYSNYFRK